MSTLSTWRHFVIPSVVAFFSLSSATVAADEADKSFAVPDAPAFTFLDATPSEITQPSSGREFLTEVLSGVGRSGQIQQGLAINSDAWFLLGTKWGGSITRDEYLGSSLWRAWANTTISLGTIRSEGPGSIGGDTDFALGLRSVLYDESDPFLDDKVRKVISDASLMCKHGPGMSAEVARKCAKQEQENSAIMKEARARAAKDWNAARISLAVASGLRFRQSRLRDNEWMGASIWLNGSYGIGSNVQLLGYARYDFRALSDSNLLRAGGRVNVGSARINGFAEAVVQHDLNAQTDKTTSRWAVGVSCGLTSSLWLTGSLGSTIESSNAPLAVLASFKYNFSTVPELDP